MWRRPTGAGASRRSRSLSEPPRRQASAALNSGSGADWNDVDSYFRPNGLGSYMFDANNNIVFLKHQRLFDLAIMMDCSQCPVHPQLKSIFQEFVRRHSETARKHGTKPVWFM